VTDLHEIAERLIEGAEERPVGWYETEVLALARAFLALQSGYDARGEAIVVLEAQLEAQQPVIERYEKALREISEIEYTDEVDVNGEYMTTRPRPSNEIRWEIEKIIALAAAPPEAKETP